ncbi:lipocalin family protein [Deinococcus puniceus]|uniref:AttH protein n=1 Tax=Deinococcus puniceus TaxID=1182568 RepID=A0A172T876_9DEIO|nr:lipocalin family protein [Deinococcus puniceus]ANE43238.1 attH protein [Deinococcus puniceus]
MKKALLLAAAAAALLSACAPTQTTFDPLVQPLATDLGPHNNLMEWWYVSGSLPEEGLAFHWAQFQVRPPGVPLPIMISHVAVTDLATGKVTFIEKNPAIGSGTASFPPLKLTNGDWTFQQEGGAFDLKAGPLNVRLTPQKGPVIHPPGYSGSPETGYLYYQGITRLALDGQINGRTVKGEAWLDHQWGNQIPGQAALWDWMAVQLAGGEDLMVYRVRTAAGKQTQLVGSIVDKAGVARAATNLTLEPGRTWTGSGGRVYTLSWRVKADEFDLNVDAVRDEQELLSRSTSIAYWEGPVRVSGTWRGQPETGKGMMEIVGGSLGGGR